MDGYLFTFLDVDVFCINDYFLIGICKYHLVYLGELAHEQLVAFPDPADKHRAIQPGNEGEALQVGVHQTAKAHIEIIHLVIAFDGAGKFFLVHLGNGSLEHLVAAIADR